MAAGRHGLAIGAAAAALVECECCIDEIAPVPGEPVGPVEGARGFLAAGQCQLDRAAGAIVAGRHPGDGVGPDRGHGLVVKAAARVEIGPILDQGEGIADPVLSLGLHHIEMREQQYRLRPAGAGVDGHETTLLRVIRHGKQGDLALRQARGAQSGGHALGRQRAAASRQRGVGLHQFLEQRTKGGLVRALTRGIRQRRSRGGQQPRRGQRRHAPPRCDSFRRPEP